MKVSCLSAFGDKAVMPDDNAVSAVIGGTTNIWDELLAVKRLLKIKYEN